MKNAGQQPFFGRVVDEDVHLSAVGTIVAEEWLRTEQIRLNVTLDERVIMPNHMRGIIAITNKFGRISCLTLKVFLIYCYWKGKNNNPVSLQAVTRFIHNLVTK